MDGEQLVTTPIISERNPRLTTPRAAAAAGIAFALLFATSLVFIRLSIPGELIVDVDWIAQAGKYLSIALVLMPLAGVAFLWFIGVIRDQLGEAEDRFFATVFFGSSLLFMAMVFVAMAIAGAVVASAAVAGVETINQDVVLFGRAMMLQISNVYALRMAGVLMISLGTIWLRTQLMPRWLAGVTYAVALTLLVVVSLSLWVSLLFPAWVLVVSVYVLFLRRRPQPAVALGGEG